MDETTVKYINPITVEAEVFLNSLEYLSKTYKTVDIVLVSTLERIMVAIENFLESSPNELVETGKSKLVKCDQIKHISRIFCCSLCRRDIGKSVEKVALHLTENCTTFYNGGRPPSESCDIPKIQSLGRVEAAKASAKNSDRSQSTKLSRKTNSLLTSNLNNFIEDQVKICTKFKCLSAYDKIEKDLIELSTPLFPCTSVQVYKFGSRIAGIGNRDSDLDLYMDIGENFTIYQERADAENIQKLHKVEKALKSNSKSWKIMRSVTKARVPILKVIHRESGIECDINFSNSMGVVNTNFLEYIFNLQPIVQCLCCFMKKWLSRTKLGDDINTYSMNLMVLFHFQTLKLLPSMESLQQDIKENKSLKIGHWLCTFATYSLKELNIQPVPVDKTNLRKYLNSFFTFYINFKFGSNVICPYLGQTISKAELENAMPERYTSYVKSFPDYKFQMDKPLAVQDPLQLNYNTTKNVDKTTFATLKRCMILSLQILEDAQV